MRALMLVLPAMLFGCAHGRVGRPYADIPVVKRFADIPANLNKRVRIRGFASFRHEAVGVYFKRGDLYAPNDMCIEVNPQLEKQTDSGMPVELMGTLRLSDCATGTICITACNRYILER